MMLRLNSALKTSDKLKKEKIRDKNETFMLLLMLLLCFVRSAHDLHNFPRISTTGDPLASFQSSLCSSQL